MASPGPRGGFMHQRRMGRLPLAAIPGAIAFPMLDGDDEVAPYERHCPHHLTLVVLPPLGRWGLAAIAATGYRRLSSSAYNVLPALAGGIRLLAVLNTLYTPTTLGESSMECVAPTILLLQIDHARRLVQAQD